MYGHHPAILRMLCEDSAIVLLSNSHLHATRDTTRGREGERQGGSEREFTRNGTEATCACQTPEDLALSLALSHKLSRALSLAPLRPEKRASRGKARNIV